jgi:hypothetical protein
MVHATSCHTSFFCVWVHGRQSLLQAENEASGSIAVTFFLLKKEFSTARSRLSTGKTDQPATPFAGIVQAIQGGGLTRNLEPSCTVHGTTHFALHATVQKTEDLNLSRFGGRSSGAHDPAGYRPGGQ